MRSIKEIMEKNVTVKVATLWLWALNGAFCGALFTLFFMLIALV